MRRIIKNPNSEVIAQGLVYKKSNNSALRKILLFEQKGYCAYTEERIECNDAVDIEHFNPTLKNTNADSYQNWFMVKHKPNNLKRSKWTEPILHPSSADFEGRLLYNDGYYFHKPEDIETRNLIELLQLNDEIFVKNRKKYIARRNDIISRSFTSAEIYFQDLVQNELEIIKYLRAIQEEFKLDIWSMIPELES